MLFSDIAKVTRASPYTVDVEWKNLERIINEDDTPVDMDPEYQRGHVWTSEQATKYVEHILRGGIGGRDVYLNSPGWPSYRPGLKCEIVDGKQRITAVRKFLRGELKIFGGNTVNDFRGPMRTTVRFHWHINDLETPAEVMRWYLEMNQGLTAHTPQEIDRVQKLLANCEGT